MASSRWRDDRAPVTRDEAFAAYGELAAEHQLTVEQMTPREQAEAAWSPTSRYSVDELEDLIRAERGYPTLDRTKHRGGGEGAEGGA